MFLLYITVINKEIIHYFKMRERMRYSATVQDSRSLDREFEHYYLQRVCILGQDT